MNDNEKIYRIFISSCQRLLQYERKILSGVILQHGQHPFQMEYDFEGTTEVRSIEVDMQKIRQSDSVICILSHLYGEVIGKKMGDIHSCPLISNKCANCSCSNQLCECSLSFTEFEFEYAKLLRKNVFVIFNKNYGNESSLDEALSINGIKDGEIDDYKNTFREYKRDYSRFLKVATTFHAYPYTTREEFAEASQNAVIAAMHSIQDMEHQGINGLGLVPAGHLNELNQTVEYLRNRLDDLTRNGIDTIYETQTFAIRALEETAQQENIYLGEHDTIKCVRILAIRGISFVQRGMGHEEWSKFIISGVFKHSQVVPVEFLLGDCNNQKLIEDRDEAFHGQAETMEEFRESYKEEMKTVQRNIDIYKKNHPCSLYLHQEGKLPFRMIFIGKYLFLSTFISGLPAAEAAVMKISYTSSLYKVCEEYYNWIKNKTDTIEKY